MHGKDSDGVALRELANDAHQHLPDRARQFYRFTSSTEQRSSRRSIQSVTHQREKPGLLRWREDGLGVVGWCPVAPRHQVGSKSKKSQRSRLHPHNGHVSKDVDAPRGTLAGGWK